jgi:hypothetical protein
MIGEGEQRGVNESQSNFLSGTWPISYNRLNVPLFYLGQDCIAIEKLSVLRTGLGTTETRRKITIVTSQDTCETTAAENESKGSLSTHRHFIEHLMCVNKRKRYKYNLD